MHAQDSQGLWAYQEGQVSRPMLAIPLISPGHVGRPQAFREEVCGAPIRGAPLSKRQSLAREVSNDDGSRDKVGKEKFCGTYGEA